MKKLFLAIATLLPMAASAQEVKDTTIVVPQTENVVRMACELSKYGYAQNDALSLIQAARLAKAAGMTEEAKEKSDVSMMRPAPEAGKKGKGNISLDPAKLLADATAMAGDDGVLLALADDVKNNVRGAVGGPKYNVDRVESNSTDSYRVQFRANELASVICIGDGDTDLDLYVYDENGNLIASDVDYSDNCVVTFTLRWTGYFSIKIKNRGNVYNRYVLRTN